jgi:hypothetical protein
VTFYLTGVKGPAVIPMLDAQTVGLLDTPATSYTKRDGWIWAADNGCFNERTYVGDVAWMDWLKRNAGQASSCLFATAPDVVGDHEATMTRSVPWLPLIRALGYPAAFVAQNGAKPNNVPWHAFDVLFIGGDTEWKLGTDAADLALWARRKGKRVHMGRVNSYKRLRHAAAIGCDTADGTFLAFGPDVNTARLASWIDRMTASPFLPLAMNGA